MSLRSKLILAFLAFASLLLMVGATSFLNHQRIRLEMAELLSMSVDGVKSLLRRVRQVLRSCVERRIG